MLFDYGSYLKSDVNNLNLVKGNLLPTLFFWSVQVLL